MSKTIDARGLSCPQPVLMAMAEIKKAEKDEMIILVDTDTAKENVSRASMSQGWQVKDVKQDDEGYQITITRS